MHRSAPQPRAGPSIREFLRYYVLVLLQDGRMSAENMQATIKEQSAGNRDYRLSGQLLVVRRDLRRVLRQLERRDLIETRRARWRLTALGEDRLAAYEEQKEAGARGKEKAARKLLKLMGEPRPGDTVLDVGTGEGFLAFKLADKGYRVLGIDSGNFDYSKDSIEKAIERAESRGGEVEFRAVAVADLVRTRERFDWVVTSQAVHCMEDQRQCLEAIHRLLKPKGTILCMDFLVGLEGFLHHGWHSFLAISREEWTQLLPQCGFGEPGFHKAGDYLVVRAGRSPRSEQKP